MFALSLALAAAAITPETTPTPLVAHSSGLPVTEVKVEGRGPYRFVIDTAASSTVVLPALRATLPFALRKRGEQLVNGAAGNAETHLVAIDTLETQGRNFTGLTAFDMPPGPIDALHVHGILGADVIAHAVLDIDPHASQWAIREAVPALSSTGTLHRVPIAIDDARAPRVTVLIDGVKVDAVVDTGAQKTILNWHAAHRLGLSAKSRGLRAGSLARGVSGHTTPNFVHTAQTLRIGTASVANPEMRIADLPVFGAIGLAGKPAMILGMDQLKHFRTIIDYRGGEMILVPPSDVTVSR